MGSTKMKEDKKEKPKEEKKEQVKPKFERQKETVKTLVRILNTDLDGEKSIIRGLTKIKGIKYTLTKAICNVSGLDPNKKLKELTEKDIIKLEEVIKDPLKFGVPVFLVNRRRDIETGKDMHLTGLDLDLVKKFDIQRYVNLRTYRGWRHMLGQPVRGQSTRSSFRTKGRSVGVLKSGIKQQAAAAKKTEEEKKK
jgi:small subunit ribosomal protein S13